MILSIFCQYYDIFFILKLTVYFKLKIKKGKNTKQITENMIKPLKKTEIIKVNVCFNVSGANCRWFFAGQKAHMAFVSSQSFARKLFIVYGDRILKE